MTKPDTPLPPPELQTEWAEERTVLAIERTFAGWLRTGMGAIGVAVGLHVVFGPSTSGLAGRSAATLFIVIALVIFVASERQTRALATRLSRERPMPKQAPYTRISLLFILATLSVGVMLWAL